MIFSILLVLLFVALLIYTPKKYKRISNPALVFTGLWAGISFLSSLRLFSLREASLEAYFIIFLGTVLFDIGYLISILYNTYLCKRKTEKKKEYTINYQIVYLLGLCCVTYFVPGFVQSIKLFLQGNTLEDIRFFAQNGNFFVDVFGDFNNILHNFLVLPSATMIEVVAVADLIAGKKDKKLFGLNIIIILMRLITDAGRTPLVNLFIYLLIGFSLKEKNKKEEKETKGKKNLLTGSLIIAGIIIMIILSLMRTSHGLIRNVYFYFAMAPVLLTYWKNSIDSAGLVTFGITALNGYFFSASYILKNTFKTNYPGLVKKSYDAIAATDSKWIAIAGPYTKANAYVSLFWFFYLDGGIIGVTIWSLLYGLLMSYVYAKLLKDINVKSLSIYLLLFQGLIFSFIRFPFAKVYYALAFILIMILIYKKKDDYENVKM